MYILNKCLSLSILKYCSGFIALALLSVSFSTASELENEWKLKKEKHGIKVFMKHKDESRLKTAKAVAEITVDDPYSIVAVLNDYETIPKWFHLVSKVEDLGRKSEVDRDVRIVSDLPWPLKDREVVSHVLIEQDPATYAVRLEFKNKPGLLPPNKDYLRVEEYEGYLLFEFLGNKRVKLTFEAIGDPGGNIPYWMANMLAAEIPYFSIKRMIKYIEKEKFQGQNYDYVEIPDFWASEIPTTVAVQ